MLLLIFKLEALVPNATQNKVSASILFISLLSVFLFLFYFNENILQHITYISHDYL